MKDQRTRMSGRAASAVAMASALLAMGLGAGCGTDGSFDEPVDSKVTMISYEPQADGTLKAISQAIPVAEFRALQEARAKGQEQQQAGLQVAHEALTYRGTGIGTSACIDLRTTWIYNAPDGWNHPENVVVGCFGAGPSGDWTGQSYLGTAFVSESQTWASAIRSIWTGSTYRVKLWTTRPVTYNTQVRANTGYPKLVIEHVQ